MAIRHTGVVAPHRKAKEERFQALAADWLDGLDSDNTRDAYRRDLAVFNDWCEGEGGSPLTADGDDIDRYRDACDGEGAGQATIARRLSALSSFYEHARQAEAVQMNPVESVGRPARTATPDPSLDDEQSADLFAAAEALGSKVAVLVGLLLWDGMKLGEALAVEVEQIEKTHRGLQATVSRRGESRSVPLDRRTAAAIRRHLDGRAKGPLLVGASPTQQAGLRLTRFGADFLLKQAADHAGLGRAVSANTLRRSYITAAERHGRPVEDIRRHVGHTTARDTRRYLT
ncbi:MAG TPA: site-specific integrase [Acidimicrobiia bacterium]